MNSNQQPDGRARKAFNWREDLSAARDLTRREIDFIGFVVAWFEEWRVRGNLGPGRDSAAAFWREAVA